MSSRVFGVVVLACCIYLAIGALFAELSARANSEIARLGWRWAAWAVSGVVFGAHIFYEKLRSRNSSVIAAWHVSASAALAAFGLAVLANLHAWAFPPHRSTVLIHAALVLWPAITLLPAFVAALVGSWIVGQFVRNKKQ
jgi:hypothetical protein